MPISSPVYHNATFKKQFSQSQSTCSMLICWFKEMFQNLVWETELIRLCLNLCNGLQYILCTINALLFEMMTSSQLKFKPIFWIDLMRIIWCLTVIHDSLIYWQDNFGPLRLSLEVIRQTHCIMRNWGTYCEFFWLCHPNGKIVCFLHWATILSIYALMRYIDSTQYVLPI